LCLEYGKYLLSQDEKEGAGYIVKAAEILRRRIPTIRVRKARKDVKKLLAGLPKGAVPSQEARIERIETDRDNLQKVLEITKAMNLETRRGKLLERIVDAAIETTGAERGFVVLVDGEQWEFAAQRNYFTDIISEPDYQLIREIVTRVVSSGTHFAAGNIKRPETLRPFTSRHPHALKGIFAFPLAMKDKVIGAVYLDNRFAVLDLPEDGLGFMLTLMEQAALIIERTGLYEEVRTLSEKLGEKLKQTRFELKKKQQELELRYSYENIIGRSPKMQQLFRLLDKAAGTDLPVYICGESGTGKELVAKAIHYRSNSRKSHFVALDCAALPENLIESELFGYDKGAFTGADTDKIGLLEMANEGTFFLDEVGNMSAAMQQKLLRVLQEKEIRRIGGRRSIKINCRILSASNQDPHELIKAGRLREDLFYRLNVLTVNLPALRERREDIPFLVEHFWEKTTGVPLKALPEEKNEFLKTLMNYDWPGNVRELENEIYRLALIGRGTVETRYLSERILTGFSPRGAAADITSHSLKDVEKHLIEAVLKETKGNKAKAAKVLEIPRSTLGDKIKKYGISL
jgi:transcriptional regulator with GAF, ATPase, and Fis domain